MTKDQADNLAISMKIIAQAGQAKSLAMRAIQAAKKNDFSQAQNYLVQANSALNRIHNVQSALLTKTANGENVKIDLYLIHAQDHLMSAITLIDLAKEFVELYQKLDTEKE